jgi:hypothetical protein
MGYEAATFACTIVSKDDKSPEVFLILVGVVFPCIVMTACYGLIFYKVAFAAFNFKHARREKNYD